MLETYLQGADVATLTPLLVERVDVDDLRAEVDRIRRELATLAQEEQAVTHGPFPLAEAVARLDRDLEQLATRWTPDVAGYFVPVMSTGAHRPRLVPDVATFRPGVPDLHVSAEVRTQHEFTSFLVAMFRKALRERCVEALKANVPPAEAIPTAARPQRLRAIAERRHTLELEEEAAICTAAERRITIGRRGDADPAIVLLTVLDGDGA
jgi:hypothetical protein